MTLPVVVVAVINLEIKMAMSRLVLRRCFSTKPWFLKEMQRPEDLEKAIDSKDRPVLIQAGAKWCKPC